MAPKRAWNLMTRFFTHSNAQPNAQPTKKRRTTNSRAANQRGTTNSRAANQQRLTNLPPEVLQRVANALNSRNMGRAASSSKALAGAFHGAKNRWETRKRAVQRARNVSADPDVWTIVALLRSVIQQAVDSSWSQDFYDESAKVHGKRSRITAMIQRRTMGDIISQFGWRVGLRTWQHPWMLSLSSKADEWFEGLVILHVVRGAQVVSLDILYRPSYGNFGKVVEAGVRMYARDPVPSASSRRRTWASRREVQDMYRQLDIRGTRQPNEPAINAPGPSGANNPLVPGRGAPFNVLRGPGRNTRTLRQRVRASAAHPAVTGSRR